MKFLPLLVSVASTMPLFADTDPDWIARTIDDDERQNYSVFSVGAGETKTLRQLSIRGDGTHASFSKTGAGELQLGGLTKLSGDGVAMETGGAFDIGINDGTFTILAPASAAEDGFDSGAYLHVDASEGTTLTVDGEGHVSVWRDVRASGGHDMSGGFDAGKPTSLPRLVESALPGGKTVVDLGVYAEGANINETTGTGYLTFPPAYIREGFFVMRQKEPGPDGAQPFFLGDVNEYSFHRGANPYASGNGVTVLDGQASAEKARGAGWRVDGGRVSPVAFALDYGFHLVSFNAEEGVLASTVGWDRTFRCGGLEIAEVLLFTTELDPEERRAIEVRLMEKWMPSKTHPSAAEPVEIASLVSTNLTARRAVEIHSLGAGGNTFVKAGSGDVDVYATDRLGGAVAREGRLRFLSGAASLLKGAFLHIDPNVPGSLVFDSTGRVCKVMSLVGDGNHIRNTYSARSGATLRTETIGGSQLKVLDFGPYYAAVPANCLTNNAPDSERAPEGVCGMEWAEGTASLRSFFAVVKDNQTIHPDSYGYGTTAISDQYILGSDHATDFDRSSHCLIGQGNASVLGQVAWKLDTLAVNPKITELDGGYHIVSCVIPDGYASVAVNRVAQDVQNRIGGLSYGEIIAYTRTLAADEEKTILDYLVGKWRGGERYGVETLMKSANIHYDPSDAASLTMANGAEVVEMRDVRTCCTNSHNAIVTPEAIARGANPTIVPYGANGLKMIDFGMYDEVASPKTGSTDASGMMFLGSDEESFKTIFVVAERTGPSDIGNEQFLFGGSRSGNSYQFHSVPGKYLASFAAPSVKDYATWEVDGETIDQANAAWPLDTVQVFAIRGDEPMWFSQLAQDRAARIGGIRYGEILLFERKLGDADYAMIRNHLLDKWLGIEGAAVPQEESSGQAAFVAVGELGVDSGAGLSFDGDVALADGGIVEIELPAGAIAVGGSFKAGSGVTVRVSARRGAPVPAGTLPAVSAARFVSAENVASWSLDTSGLDGAGFNVELVRSVSGGAINLVVRPRGMVVIVK